MVRVISLSSSNLNAALDEAASVLKSGGLVAYPTETFYALGADALSPGAVERVYAAKGREPGKPLLVVLHDKSLVGNYALLDDDALVAVERLTPGPVTLVFRAAPGVPDNLAAGTGTVAVRVPMHEAAAGLARALGGPVTATSANLSGEPGLTTAEEVARQLGGLDLILDGGPTPGGPATTILDLTVSPPRVLREGGIKRAELERRLGMRVLQ